ncbi:MAG: alpha-D-ribose 1-methylphosphonate 5-triphosphate diphosphatase [Thermus sp.]|uniref:alpha-D-ribose 1-methylphosphonate 5-triphosphate diphosphatase n=1 Tax=Thermus sp. TaxID=275 RepID=UPI003919EF98
MWLRNLKVVLPDGVIRGASLHIEGDRIADIVLGRQGGVDCGGLTAIPGLVDLHSDTLERELVPRPGVELPTELALLELDKRLVSNGITTAYVTVSLGLGPDLSTQEKGLRILEAIEGMRDYLLSEVRVHVRLEITANRDVVEWVVEAIQTGRVHLVSLMDHSPGQGQFRDLESFVRYYQRWLGVGSEEAYSLAEDRMRKAASPQTWELAQRVARAALEKGIPLASHDDDKEEKVALVHNLGASISEFPVSLAAAELAKRLGMQVVMGSPNVLLGRSHVGNLSALEALQKGVLDGLVSDYHPSSLIQSSLRLSREGLMPLSRAVKLVAENPARMAGLMDRGRITKGSLADVVLVEEGEYPRVRATLRRGRFVYWDGSFCGILP